MLREAQGAEACLLSCGNWRTLEAIEPLEAEFGIPVLTSNQTGLWQVLQMSGIPTKEVTGGGQLFELPDP
jgi:maleate cis-trans isomerase